MGKSLNRDGTCRHRFVKEAPGIRRSTKCFYCGISRKNLNIELKREAQRLITELAKVAKKQRDERGT